jgi:heme/copper-type cytochrome/quinol oxidase subunit 3
VWPPPGVEAPELRLTIPFSIVLWASSVPIFLAEHDLRHGRIGRARTAMAVSFVMGAAFLAYTLHDFGELTYGWRDHAYGSIYYVVVGLHAIHVFIGLSMSGVVQAKAWLGRYDGGRHASAQAFFLYWHFVDVVWIAVFALVIAGPHLR